MGTASWPSRPLQPWVRPAAFQVLSSVLHFKDASALLPQIVIFAAPSVLPWPKPAAANAHPTSGEQACSGLDPAACSQRARAGAGSAAAGRQLRSIGGVRSAQAARPPRLLPSLAPQGVGADGGAAVADANDQAELETGAGSEGEELEREEEAFFDSAQYEEMREHFIKYVVRRLPTACTACTHAGMSMLAQLACCDAAGTLH